MLVLVSLANCSEGFCRMTIIMRACSLRWHHYQHYQTCTMLDNMHGAADVFIISCTCSFCLDPWVDVHGMWKLLGLLLHRTGELASGSWPACLGGHSMNLPEP